MDRIIALALSAYVGAPLDAPTYGLFSQTFAPVDRWVGEVHLGERTEVFTEAPPPRSIYELKIWLSDPSVCVVDIRADTRKLLYKHSRSNAHEHWVGFPDGLPMPAKVTYRLERSCEPVG